MAMPSLSARASAFMHERYRRSDRLTLPLLTGTSGGTWFGGGSHFCCRCEPVDSAHILRPSTLLRKRSTNREQPHLFGWPCVKTCGPQQARSSGGHARRHSHERVLEAHLGCSAHGGQLPKHYCRVCSQRRGYQRHPLHNDQRSSA